MAAVLKPTARQILHDEGLRALQAAVADFDRDQLLWSSGYLAGMSAVNTAVALPAAAGADSGAAEATWSIFYATETGNSRRVADLLADRYRDAGIAVELHDLAEFRPKALSRIGKALFVVATHGIGEAPEGSEQFFEFWLSDRAPRLEQLEYSILALGDSSYADYCEMGRVLDERLQALGATAIVERVDCDVDFDAPAAGWRERIVELAATESTHDAGTRTAVLTTVSARPVVSRDHPFDAEIVVNQKITGRASSKDVRHIELALEGSGLSYLPGDSLGVVPQNPPELVDQLLQATRLDGGDAVSLDGGTMPLRSALTTHKEITALSRPFLNAVSAGHPELEAIAADREQLQKLFDTRQIIDVVADYPRSWSAQEFIDALRKLTPRLYSIASCPDTNPDEAHLTVSVVQYTRFGRHHWGSASSFLSGGADRAPVYVEPNPHFRLPADGDTPIIMVGAGTGVAPYRAFVQHRLEHGHHGDNWLIFGDRNLSTDFLYQIEWLRHRKAGALQRLDVAFSRDQQEKHYVQQRILEQSKHLFAWLERGAHLYVCGDAEHMARDVNAALLTVVQNEADLSRDGATEYLADLKAAHRYQRDVY